MPKKFSRQRRSKKTKNLSLKGQWKGIRNKRQGEIYHYVSQETYKEQYLSGYQVPPELKASEKRQFLDYVAQEQLKKHHWTKEQRNYLLKETAKLYREEIDAKKNQILWYQENAGFTKPNPKRIKKNQKPKLIFPEKGEHKEFHARKKTFWQIWQEKVLKRKGSISDKKEVEKLTQELYYASPRRLRDRFLTLTEDKGKSYSVGEVWEKYYKNNPFAPTQKHYRQAINNVLKQTTTEGEKVPESEIVTDKYGRPILQPGQVIQLGGDRPGRGWTIYKKVPSLETQIKTKVHNQAHQGYIEEYGTELEKQTWRLKKDKSLCWVEAVLGQSCRANQGTSEWWCLFCITWGEYHPPVLPIHCPWLYTYKKHLCGGKLHSDATKQWHFSVQGERIRDAIKGNDWGSCHVGTFSKPRKSKPKKQNWILKG